MPAMPKRLGAWLGARSRGLMSAARSRGHLPLRQKDGPRPNSNEFAATGGGQRTEGAGQRLAEGSAHGDVRRGLATFEAGRGQRTEGAGQRLAEGSAHGDVRRGLATFEASWTPTDQLNHLQAVEWKATRKCLACNKSVQLGQVELVESACVHAWRFLSHYHHSPRLCGLQPWARPRKFFELRANQRAAIRGQWQAAQAGGDLQEGKVAPAGEAAEANCKLEKPRPAAERRIQSDEAADLRGPRAP
eukprot:GHVT01103818.1.p1 GENE.GHVT01103818.1~~GHVT01103818.1.p1  ORF type:complete len:246 (+),score=59.26 GHVT01103818.1:491-1228(+)